MDLHIEGIASSFDDAVKQACEQADKFFGQNRFYVLKDFEAHPHEISYGVHIPDGWGFSAIARLEVSDSETTWHVLTPDTLHPNYDPEWS